jgi:hypothetical protein
MLSSTSAHAKADDVLTKQLNKTPSINYDVFFNNIQLGSTSSFTLIEPYDSDNFVGESW